MKAEGVQLQSEQKCRKVLLVAKETGTAVHGKTSDMGYFLFLPKKEIEGGLKWGEQAIFEDCDTLQAVMDQEFAKSFTPGPEKMGRWTEKKEGRRQRLVAMANP